MPNTHSAEERRLEPHPHPLPTAPTPTIGVAAEAPSSSLLYLHALCQWELPLRVGVATPPRGLPQPMPGDRGVRRPAPGFGSGNSCVAPSLISAFPISPASKHCEAAGRLGPRPCPPFGGWDLAR